MAPTTSTFMHISRWYIICHGHAMTIWLSNPNLSIMLLPIILLQLIFSGKLHLIFRLLALAPPDDLWATHLLCLTAPISSNFVPWNLPLVSLIIWFLLLHVTKVCLSSFLLYFSFLSSLTPWVLCSQLNQGLQDDKDVWSYVVLKP